MHRGSDRTPLGSPGPNRAQRRASVRRRATAVGSAALLTTAAGVVGLWPSVPAGADPFGVTTCANDGIGSLREALGYADANPGPDVITITASCPAASPVALTSDLDITAGDVTITGPGAADFVLDGGDTVRILRVATTGDVALSGMTLRNGFSGGAGGAILLSEAGSLTLSGVVVADSHGLFGGALYAANSDTGSLVVVDSLFDGNTADAGGAFYLGNDGGITISSSTFTENTATSGSGAIGVYAATGTFTMTNSTVTGNTAGTRGGGIFFSGLYDDVTLLFNTIADNAAAEAGGVDARGVVNDVTIVGNVFTGNDGDQARFGAGWTVTEHHNDFHGTVVGFTPDATDLDVDPQLAALADNGGQTPTRALAATSPVIDHGPATWPAFPGEAYDQRGTPYVRVFGGAADMGAFEWQVLPEPPGPTPEPTPEPNFTG